MPIHDWKKVSAGLFHDFHIEWMRAIKHTLNKGLLPPGYFAIVEQYTEPDRVPDVLALERKTARARRGDHRHKPGAVALLEKPKLKRTGLASRELDAYRKR